MRQTIRHTLLLLGILALLPATGALAAAKPEKQPTAPPDARWTISCQAFQGPARIEEAKRVRDAMVKQTRDRDWYVVHGEHDSTLFFGFYRSTDVQATDSADRKDAERAHADRKRLGALRNGRDTALFPTCLLVPLDSPGDEGPPEWNIQNAPADARWTLLIGVYRDDPARRKAAVAAVRLLRSQGHEAFCLHLEFTSLVYVGQWPAAAALVEEPDTSRLSHGENERVMVVDRVLDPRTPTTYTDTDGAIVHLVGPTLSIRDASIKEMMAKFPHYHTNGEVLGKRIKDPKTGAARVEYEPSALSLIPRRDASILNNGALPPAAIKTISPTGVQPPKGTGKLKSLDDK